MVDPLQMKLLQQQLEYQQNIQQMQQEYAEKVAASYDPMADDMVQYHLMYGDDGLRQILNNYTSNDAEQGLQALRKVAERLNRQGEHPTADAIKQHLEGWE